MSDNYEERYTDPELRREIKEDLMESDKGGRLGQWSARKSQLLVQEYERRGGGYLKSEKDQDAKDLERWTNQDWQTSDGSAYADEGEKMKRYLPAKAWDLLSDEEKRRAERTKEAGDADGKQFVENTIAAKAARAYVDHGDASELSEQQLLKLTKDELTDLAQRHDISGRSSMNKEQLATSIRDHFESAPDSLNRVELYERAKELEVVGRSTMDKHELLDAVASKRPNDE